MPEFVEGKTNLMEWIETGIQGYREWYQPVHFGDGQVAHVTVPPDWHTAPDLDSLRGLAKWERIVKSHIPDVRGKRVLDLGCNNGLFSIELAKMGAAEVIGIDRNQVIRQKSGPQLPYQDVIAQAEFVKRAFELKQGVTYPVRYMAADVGSIENLDLGRFDLILALCIVYHELDETPKLISELSKMSDHLVLQTTLLHSGKLSYWADPYVQARILSLAGYSNVQIDAPAGYSWPVLVATR